MWRRLEAGSDKSPEASEEELLEARVECWRRWSPREVEPKVPPLASGKQRPPRMPTSGLAPLGMDAPSAAEREEQLPPKGLGGTPWEVGGWMAPKQQVAPPFEGQSPVADRKSTVVWARATGNGRTTRG